MKRYDNLFDCITDMENLYAAYENARKRRHFKAEIMAIAQNIEEVLGDIRRELLSGEWQPGGYYQFECRTEVKRRIINAPTFRDRIVHHAVVQIVMPLFEKKFIYHSYACRLKPTRFIDEPQFFYDCRKKGTHRAVKELQHFMRSMSPRAYILQCDISKYYLTIDHEILKNELRRTIADERLLGVWDKIIDSYHEPINPVIQEIYAREDNFAPPDKTGKGVPIGALTSQLAANIYLNRLDHFVKEGLRVKKYLRYMDDFIIVASTKAELYYYLGEIKTFVESKLKLKLNPKTKIFPASRGVDFAGYRTFRDYILPRKRNIKAAKIRFKNLSHQYKYGRVDFDDVRSRVGSFLGYVKHCKARRTTDSTLVHLVLRKGE